MDELRLPPEKAAAWTRVLARLYQLERDEAGLSADDLAELSGDADPLGGGTRVLAMLQQMKEAGLLTGGARLSAFVAWGVAEPSTTRCARLVQGQAALLNVLPELSMGEDTGEWLHAEPEHLALHLNRQDGLELPRERITLLLRSLERDGLGLADEVRSLDIRFVRRGTMAIRARRSWSEIARLGRLRSEAATVITDALSALASKGQEQGKTVLVGFDLDELVRALEGSLLLAGHIRSATALADQTLLLLHDARVLTLQGGMAVFRQAMMLRRRADGPRQLRRESIEPLLHHQGERTLQVHVVGEYAKLGATGISAAQALSRDWFAAPREEFLRRWFPGRKEELARATSGVAYERIVQVLDLSQRQVVTASPTQNLLVLAGPGSGKTRALVHRVAWLVRVQRVRPEGILVVCYTRANAMELRHRLRALIEQEARGVTVTTLHGLALRLTGRRPDGELRLETILEDALAVLQGQRATDGTDADELRELALRGATHLLVDEYQDLDAQQVRLIEAIAGRTHPDSSQRLTIFAVGDDDQAIFGWRGGSASWIKAFGAAWEAKELSLGACYRCTQPILDAAMTIITPVGERLKAQVRLRARGDGAPVRRWSARPDQIGSTVLAALDGGASSDVAILGRTRAALAQVRGALEAAGIPVAWPLGHEEGLPLARIREVVRVLQQLEARAGEVLDGGTIDQLADVGMGPWRALLQRWRDDVMLTHGETGATGATLRHALWEQLVTERGERLLGDGVRLGTLHGAKGLEWSRVILVDDGNTTTSDDDRRLWYVGATRARDQLDLILREDRPNPLLSTLGEAQAAPFPGHDGVRVHYALLSLGDVWIDGLGRDAGAPGHGVLDALPFGATVQMEERGDRTVLMAEGAVIAWLTTGAASTWRSRGASLRFVAAVRRTADQTEEAWRPRLQCAAWWVPVCEGRWEG